MKGQKASLIFYCILGFFLKIYCLHPFCVIISVFCSDIGVSSHVDDEYKWAGVEDPKVMVTTSRDPSSRLKMFVKVSFSVVNQEFSTAGYW